MYLYIIVVAILLVATISQELNLLHYLNKDKDKLMDCIKNSEYIENVKKLRGSDFVHIFAEFASEELSGTTNEDTDFLNDVIDFFRDQPHDFPSTSSGGFWNEEIVDAFRNAMIYCSDDYDFKLCLDTNHLANRRLLPRYEDELDEPEITRFLDLAVTTFPENVCAMASTPAGFMTLMRFTIDFVNATVQLYNYFESNANEARIAVREMWEYRIRNNEFAVCHYHYDARDGQVYTCGCNTDGNRYPNITLRNQKVRIKEVLSILQFFLSYSVSGRGDNTFIRYRTEGMRVYERDFEKLLMQKYRVAIFMYWLRLRHILTDQTEITQAFIDDFPIDVQNMLHYNMVYINRMIRLGELCTRHGMQHPMEEDVILHLNNVVKLIAPKVPANFTITPRPPTTEKPFYKRLGDNVYSYLTGWCDGNHEGESLAGDVDSRSQNFFNQKDSKNYHQCGTYSNSAKNEAKFVVRALSFVMDSRLCAGS